MTSIGDSFRVEWNGHDGLFRSMFGPLLDSEMFTDVTLATRDGSVKCHRLVLAACSPYLQELLVNSCSQYPILVLHDIELSHLKAIISFLYHGEMQVPIEQMDAVTRVCKNLGIRGFTSDLLPRKSKSPPVELIQQMSQSTENHVPSESPKPRPQSLESCELQLEKLQRNSDREESSEYESQTPEDEMSPVFPLPKRLALPAPFLGPFCPGTNFIGDLKGDFNNSFDLAKSRSRTDLKRYRQYTTEDINQAVEAIRNGMAIARASQAFHVPSRTLYDKVKKLGIPTRRYPKMRYSSHSTHDDDDDMETRQKRKAVDSTLPEFPNPNQFALLPRDFSRRISQQDSETDDFKRKFVGDLKEISKKLMDRKRPHSLAMQSSTEESPSIKEENIDLKVNYFIPAHWRDNLETKGYATPMDLSPGVSSKVDPMSQVTNVDNDK